MYRNIKNRTVCFQNRPLPKSWKQISSIFYWAKTVQHAISQLWKSVNPYCKRQNPKMKLWEVCPLSSTNHKTLKTTAFCRYLLYRHSSHNREFHNANWQILWCDSQCWLGMYKRPLTSHSCRVGGWKFHPPLIKPCMRFSLTRLSDAPKPILSTAS